MRPRLLAPDAAIVALADADPVAGEPRSAAMALETLADVEVGIWEIDPGVARDVEADEVFVVLSGRAEVALDSGELLALEPGTVVRLYAGDRTTWTVHERLRKLYLSRS
jgi:uncharacterized protein